MRAALFAVDDARVVLAEEEFGDGDGEGMLNAAFAAAADAVVAEGGEAVDCFEASMSAVWLRWAAAAAVVLWESRGLTLMTLKSR